MTNYGKNYPRRISHNTNELSIIISAQANWTVCARTRTSARTLYIMRKELDGEKIKEILTTLTSLFTVIDLRETDLLKAADLDFSDYEDALQAVCAARAKTNYIVTRNIKDFTYSPVPAIKSGELLERL